MDVEIQTDAARLVRRLRQAGLRITVAESCTGGLLASTLTDIAGASDWFDQSWVTYANDAKTRVLGVNPDTLDRKGAVSAEVAIQMASGALARSTADIALSVTGIAGPGNVSDKKLGLVYVGAASGDWKTAERTIIGGTRAENKLGFVHFAIRVAIENMDAAVKRKEVRAAEDEKQREAIEAEREARQINRAAKEAGTRLDTAWQETAWSPGNEPHGEEDLGDDVEW
ncbi:MAG: CinA family protein [Candidatus Thermoplasmatota archaeon]|nr:CinA family protein [Candidatus Thermoplasmatota archaeon]